MDKYNQLLSSLALCGPFLNCQNYSRNGVESFGNFAPILRPSTVANKTAFEITFAFSCQFTIQFSKLVGQLKNCGCV